MDFSGHDGAGFAFNFVPDQDGNIVLGGTEVDGLTEQAPDEDPAKFLTAIATELPACTEEVLEKVHLGENMSLYKMVGAPTSGEELGIPPSSDLLPGVYEGGCKVWECAIDLAEYNIEKYLFASPLRVLEAGCGQGLPGIFASLSGCLVDYQDYNGMVLSKLTMPLLAANCKARGMSMQDVFSKSRFISGDWKYFTDLVNEEGKEELKYDVILTSDTLYSSSSHKKLYELISSNLKRSGRALVAAKTYYFGVGGGTRAFEDIVNQRGEMTSSIVKTLMDGSSNVREILELKFKDA